MVVNIEALDLGLGSGGFDIVHVNLTRGLEGAGRRRRARDQAQLHLAPAPGRAGRAARASEVDRDRPPEIPVLVIPLHGHLAPAAWAAGQARPGPPSRLRADGRRRAARAASRATSPSCAASGSSAGTSPRPPPTAVSWRRSASPVPSTRRPTGLGWDAAIAGAGPGIIGSETLFGHGGMAALDTAHAALALGMPTLLSPRLSEGDPRPRHRGLSHHTRTVLDLLLGGRRGAGAPAAMREDDADGPARRRPPPGIAAAGRPRCLRSERAADPRPWAGAWRRTGSSSRRRWRQAGRLRRRPPG